MITFRPIEKEDLGILKEWRNSEEVMPYVREYRYLNNTDQEKWYEGYLASRRKADFDQEIFIVQAEGPDIEEDQRSVFIKGREAMIEPIMTNVPIGVGGFTRIEWKNRKAELTFYLGKQDYENVRKAAIEKILEKGFKEFGFHKIYWPVYSHDPNLSAYNNIFDEKIILKEEYWYNGWQDRIYLSKINTS